ncbi:MAG: LysM peptidoglycan-binding domain-containing protein [Rhodanobacter sp.]
MMKHRLRTLPLSLSLLLAACATTPTPSLHAPTIAPPKPVTPDITPAVVKPTTAVAQGNVWDQLRGSFAMADCDADPRILGWAQRYTQNPQRFESQMSDIMPSLVYVEQVAAAHGVAGEFALLPWVESQFQPVPGHRSRPAGMWQIVPSTASVMGLHMDRNYDGRLDVPAATESVMSLLSRYHDDLQDWRLVDYAYNAGEFSMRQQLQRHGTPPAEPAIPKLPVRAVTREHLTKLLAIACVIRDPARFNVSLPVLPSDQHLETVQIEHPMTLANAANHAGMPVNALKQLNAGFSSDKVNPVASTQLLLPHRNAEQWRNAMQQASDGELTASVTPQPAALPQLPTDSDTPIQDDAENAPAPDTKAQIKTHKVRPGESLWQIAHNYSVSVSQLQRWNGLQGSRVKPGQILKLGSPG